MQKKGWILFFLGMVFIGLALPGIEREKKSSRRKHFSISAQYMAGFLEESREISHDEDAYFEKADYRLEYALKKGNACGLDLRCMLGKSFGIELDLGYGQRDITADLNASIPHPLWMNTPRKVQESFAGLSLKEFDVFLNAVVACRMGKFSLALYAGPGLVLARAGILEKASFQEKSYPYSDVTLLHPQVTIQNYVFAWDAGLEAGFSFARPLSLFLNACYAGGTAGFDPGGTWPSVTLTPIGFRAGAGLRFHL